jgi:hypothetical protein
VPDAAMAHIRRLPHAKLFWAPKPAGAWGMSDDVSRGVRVKGAQRNVQRLELCKNWRARADSPSLGEI